MVAICITGLPLVSSRLVLNIFDMFEKRYALMLGNFAIPLHLSFGEALHHCYISAHARILINYYVLLNITGIYHACQPNPLKIFMIQLSIKIEASTGWHGVACQILSNHEKEV